MKAVKFLLAHTVGALYNVGEIAGFEDEIADDLIERKIGEPVKANSKTAAKAKAEADAKAKAEADAKAKAEADAERAEAEALSDADQDKAITENKVKVADGADRRAKIDAPVAAVTK